MRQGSVTAIQRILLDYAIFITTLSAAIFVSLFHYFIFTVCLCLRNYRQYSSHSVNAQY